MGRTLKRPNSYSDLSNEELIRLYRFSMFMSGKDETWHYDWTENETRDYYVRGQSGLKILEKEIVKRMNEGGRA